MRHPFGTRFAWLAAAALLVVALDAAVAHANRGKLFRNPGFVLVLAELAILVGNNLAGVAAVVVGGIKAAEMPSTDEKDFLCLIAGAAGGAWTGFAWFGWPFVTETYFGTIGHPIEDSSFALTRLIALGVLACAGVAARARHPRGRRGRRPHLALTTTPS